MLGVFNLSPSVSEERLSELMEKFGVVKQLMLIKDRLTGVSKGYAFVYYDSIEDATAAKLEMNAQIIEGRQVRVDYSRTSRPYSPTPGKYMGREDQKTVR